MERRDYQPAQPQRDAAQAAESYRAPHLLVIGKATDLMKGFSVGYWYEYYGLWY